MRKWVDDAACVGLPLEMFFPPKGEEQPDIRMIVKMCNGCPVQSECLESALAIEGIAVDRHGIWGGKTPSQRSSISRERLMDETGMCPRNLHVMDEENTGWRGNKMWRFCRACQEKRHGDDYYERAS